MNKMIQNDYLKGRSVLILNPSKPNYPITYCSSAFQEITKFSREHCMGTTLKSFIKRYNGNIYHKIEQAIEEKTDLVERRITMKKLDGKEIIVQMCFCPVFNGDKARYVIVFVEDISNEADFIEKFQDYVEYKSKNKRKTRQNMEEQSNNIN